MWPEWASGKRDRRSGPVRLAGSVPRESKSGACVGTRPFPAIACHLNDSCRTSSQHALEVHTASQVGRDDRCSFPFVAQHPFSSPRNWAALAGHARSLERERAPDRSPGSRFPSFQAVSVASVWNLLYLFQVADWSEGCGACLDSHDVLWWLNWLEIQPPTVTEWLAKPSARACTAFSDETKRW